MTTNVLDIAKALQKKGVPVLKTSTGSREVDGEIKVSESIYIQVSTQPGEPYVFIVRWDGDIAYFGQPVENMDQLILACKETLHRYKK